MQKLFDNMQKCYCKNIFYFKQIGKSVAIAITRVKTFMALKQVLVLAILLVLLKEKYEP